MSACSVEKPLMLALNTPRLKDHCYHCHKTSFTVAGLPCLGKSDEEEFQKSLRACGECGVVKFCDSVSTPSPPRYSLSFEIG
jgi:hypothetical protein